MIVLFEGLTKQSTRKCETILRKAGIHFETQGHKNSFTILLINHDHRATANEQLTNCGFSPEFSSGAAVNLEYREDLNSLPNVRGNQLEIGVKSRYSKNRFRRSVYSVFALILALCGLAIFATEHYLSLSLAGQIRVDQNIPTLLRSPFRDFIEIYEYLKSDLTLK